MSAKSHEPRQSPIFPDELRPAGPTRGPTVLGAARAFLIAALAASCSSTFAEPPKKAPPMVPQVPSALPPDSAPASPAVRTIPNPLELEGAMDMAPNAPELVAMGLLASKGSIPHSERKSQMNPPKHEATKAMTKIAVSLSDDGQRVTARGSLMNSSLAIRVLDAQLVPDGAWIRARTEIARPGSEGSFELTFELSPDFKAIYFGAEREPARRR